MALFTTKEFVKLIDERILELVAPDSISLSKIPANKRTVESIGGAGVIGAVDAAILDRLEELAQTLPSRIISGLEVRATSPESAQVTVNSGIATAQGRYYYLAEESTIDIPLSLGEVQYILLDELGLEVSRDEKPTKATIAKIVIPNPDHAEKILDNKDDTHPVYDAYIVNYHEYKLLGIDDKFEEDTIDLLRNNISPILADNLIGNLRLNEDLKITNTAGSLELNSDSLKMFAPDGEIIAKFNRNGTYFYNDDGIDIAHFTVDDAKIGNILITKNSIGSENYISEVQGFNISDSGFAEFEDVRIRGRISSSVFEYDKISAVSGKLLVGNSTVLAQDVSTSDTTITVEDNVFAVGDIIRIKDGIDEEYMEVTDISNAPEYVVTRFLNGLSGEANPSWNTGTAIVSTGNGTSGQNSGFISLDAASQYSPFIDILYRESATYNDWTTKVRVGNLEGINDPDFGGTLSGFGLYAENVFLKGELFAPVIKTANSGNRIEFDTDAFIGYNSSNQPIFQILLTGANAGDTIIGNEASGNYVKWDESSGILSIDGEILADTITLGDRRFVTTLDFETTDYNTVEWDSGYIIYSDGTTKSINAGNTGDISTTTYIYYDDDVSQTELQTTTTASDATGLKKSLLAIIEPGASAATSPVITLASASTGTTISGGNIVTNSITSDKYNEVRNTYVYNSSDSLDSTHEFVVPFKIVSETNSIESIKLSFTIEKFRAYSTAALSGGGHTVPAGGGHTTVVGGGSTSGNYGGAHYHDITLANSASGSAIGLDVAGVVYVSGGASIGTTTTESHSHTFTIEGTAGVPNAIYYKSNRLMCISRGTTWISNIVNGHFHTINIAATSGTPSAAQVFESSNSLRCSGGGTVHTSYAETLHTHTTPNHNHEVSDHTHEVLDHVHGLDFGIYEESNSPTIIYYIDNGSGYGSPSSGYTTDQTDLDITSQISGTGWKKIKFTTDQRCRIDAIIECKLDISA